MLYLLYNGNFVLEVYLIEFFRPDMENPRVLTACRHTDLNVKMNGGYSYTQYGC